MRLVNGRNSTKRTNHYPNGNQGVSDGGSKLLKVGLTKEILAKSQQLTVGQIAQWPQGFSNTPKEAEVPETPIGING